MDFDFVSLGDVSHPQAMQCSDRPQLVVAMSEAGVLDDQAKPPAYVKSKRRGKIEGGCDYDERLRELNYSRRAFRSRKRGKVPRAKFSPGGWWIISAEESALIGRVMRAWLAALSAPSTYPVPRGYRRRLPPWDGFDWKYIEQYVAFCERCGKSHGFRVESPI